MSLLPSSCTTRSGWRVLDNVSDDQALNPLCTILSPRTPPHCKEKRNKVLQRCKTLFLCGPFSQTDCHNVRRLATVDLACCDSGSTSSVKTYIRKVILRLPPLTLRLALAGRCMIVAGTGRCTKLEAAKVWVVAAEERIGRSELAPPPESRDVSPLPSSARPWLATPSSTYFLPYYQIDA